MQEYYRFISQCIVFPEANKPLSEDPFAILIDQKDHLGKVYLSRPFFEVRLLAPEHQIILGHVGSGKSSLFEKLPGVQPEGLAVLSVRLALGERPHLREVQTGASGKERVLSLPWVIAAIFDAYWQARLLNASTRLNYYPRLRLDEGWREEFRWFYQHFPPADPVVYDEHELMAWLQAAPSQPLSAYSEASLLRRLVRLALRPALPVDEVGGVQAEPGGERSSGVDAQKTAAPRRPYQKIYVWLDGADHLTAQEIPQLLDDVQMLYGLGIPGLRFKLFLDDSWELRVRQVEPVSQGAIAVEYIPAWSETELSKLLLLRLQGWNPNVPQDWPNLIPSNISDYSARRYLLKRICERAVEAYTNPAWQTLPDAPVHALRLARRVLEDLAVRYERLQDPQSEPLPKFTLSDLNNLVSHYPDGEEEE